MSRPVAFILQYLIWGNSLLVYGWLGLFGSDCLNAFALLQALLASWGQPSSTPSPLFFCFQESLGDNALWVGILFFTLLPGLFTAACFWAWDRYRGIRHIDLQV